MGTAIVASNSNRLCRFEIHCVLVINLGFYYKYMIKSVCLLCITSSFVLQLTKRKVYNIFLTSKIGTGLFFFHTRADSGKCLRMYRPTFCGCSLAPMYVAVDTDKMNI